MATKDSVKKAVIEFIKQHGYSPTVRDICLMTSRSAGVVHSYMTEMLRTGELMTDAPLGSQRALRVPGMRWIDTKEYTGVVKQLYRLLEHCREMAAEPGCADDWEQDVDALEKVIRALEREER